MKKWSKLSKWAAVSSVVGLLLTSFVFSTRHDSTTSEQAATQSIEIENTPSSPVASPSASKSDEAVGSSSPTTGGNAAEQVATGTNTDNQRVSLPQNDIAPTNDAPTPGLNQAEPDPVPTHLPASSQSPNTPHSIDADNEHLSNDEHYVNVLGHTVHSPAYTPHGEVPAGASAFCRDGTYSFSESHRGTCSHHGGVATWLH